MSVSTEPCWRELDAVAVINPEAEHVPDDVFRAVHTDFGLRLRQGSETGPVVSITLAEFLDRFLDPDRRHVQAAVIGTSGSGKSHLIQWLRLAIPEDPSRKVINIPKAGTSLRGIVERMIDELPTHRQTEFRDALSGSGHSRLSEAGKIDHLLDNLALAIGNDEQPGIAVDDPDLAEELKESLPAVFRDPYFRKQHFGLEGGFISTLVRHVFSAPTEYERTEDRREFRRDDLPLAGLHRQHASTPAKDALDAMLDEGASGAQAAVNLVNRNLDVAIGLSLSFTGDRVVELMNRVRTYFYEQGQELVLLIEDLARLQGIDYSLLQALIEQGGDTMCPVRWAIAVTTGFYRKLPPTVRTRMSLIVDMDMPTEEKTDAVSEVAVARLAGRYLNAARLGKDRLAGATAVDEADWQTSSRCTDCEHQRDCHAAFGAEDGYGLFPWTHAALWEMGRRAGAIGRRGFNPRAFQRAVLLPVLKDHRDSLVRGEFPPSALLEALGGLDALGTGDEMELQKREPECAGRRLALLELWDGSGNVKNLAAGVHEAFRLPPLEGVHATPTAPEPGGSGAKPQVEPGVTSTFSVGDLLIDELKQWPRGGSLSQHLMNRLRTVTYDLIIGAIDWDGLGWERSYFTRKNGGLFKASGQISFVRQTTTPHAGAIALQFPADENDADEFAMTSLAFQGLLQFVARGDWEFKDGGKSQAYLLEVIDAAAARVVGQIEEHIGRTKEWDPLRAACELRVLVRHLDGRARSGETELDILGTALRGPPRETPSGDELGDCRRILGDARKALDGFVLAHAKGLKNGSGGEALIDALPLFKTVRHLRKTGWVLGQTPPKVAKARGGGDLAVIARTYARVLDALGDAATRERDWYREQLVSVDAALGTGCDIPEWQQRLEEAADVADKIGMAVGSPALRTTLSALNRTATNELKAAREAAASESPSGALPVLGRGRRSQFTALLKAVAAGGTFLDKYDSAVKLKKQHLTDQEEEAHEAHSTIVHSLKSIAAALRQLEAQVPGEAQPEESSDAPT